MADTQDLKFREELGGFFYDMMKSAGFTMFPGNFPERVRDIGNRMSTSIEKAAERKSIEVIKKLQEAVLTAFEGYEKEQERLEKLILTAFEGYEKEQERLEKLILLQQDQINLLRENLNK